MIRVTFDGVEYFNFKSGQFNHNIEENLAFKQCSLQATPQEPFKDFITIINEKNWVLARVYVDDKIWLDGFVNDTNFTYSRTGSETTIQLTFDDRFIGLRESDIIKTQPNGTIVNYLSKILDELNYNGSLFLPTYESKIKTTKDLIALGEDVKDVNLKSFVRNDLTEYKNSQVLGEICSLANVIIISNGYDKLTIEKTTTNTESVYDMLIGTRTQVSYAEKVGRTSLSERIIPSKVIILNSKDGNDNYSSIVKFNNSGIPHIQKIKHINTKTSYSEIDKGLDYSFAGIKAVTNSFLYKISNTIFDDNGEFFAPNRCVYVNDPVWGIDEKMRILQSSFSIDSENGNELNLNVTTQEAFDNNASIKQKRALMNR
jgi:hypothetical protein